MNLHMNSKYKLRLTKSVNHNLLHKIGKQWAVISFSTIALLLGASALPQATHADTNAHQTAVVKPAQNKPVQNSHISNSSQEQTMASSNSVMDKANQMHQSLMNHTARQNTIRLGGDSYSRSERRRIMSIMTGNAEGNIPAWTRNWQNVIVQGAVSNLMYYKNHQSQYRGKPLPKSLIRNEELINKTLVQDAKYCSDNDLDPSNPAQLPKWLQIQQKAFIKARSNNLFHIIENTRNKAVKSNKRHHGSHAYHKVNLHRNAKRRVNRRRRVRRASHHRVNRRHNNKRHVSHKRRTSRRRTVRRRPRNKKRTRRKVIRRRPRNRKRVRRNRRKRTRRQRPITIIISNNSGHDRGRARNVKKRRAVSKKNTKRTNKRKHMETRPNIPSDTDNEPSTPAPSDGGSVYSRTQNANENDRNASMKNDSDYEQGYKDAKDLLEYTNSSDLSSNTSDEDKVSNRGSLLNQPSYQDGFINEAERCGLPQYRARNLITAYKIHANTSSPLFNEGWKYGLFDDNDYDVAHDVNASNSDFKKGWYLGDLVDNGGSIKDTNSNWAHFELLGGHPIKAIESKFGNNDIPDVSV